MAPSGDLALLLTAVVKLAAGADGKDLTPRRILAAAGVPRRSFFANFSNADDCLVAALELQAGEAIARAKQAGEMSPTRAGCIHQAVLSLCTQIAGDRVLANLCFGEAATASIQRMRCQERLMGNIGRLAKDELAPAHRDLDEVVIDASVGALWGALQGEVRRGRAGLLPQVAPTLTYLVLAPTVGAPMAIDAIREQCAIADEGRSEAPQLASARDGITATKTNNQGGDPKNHEKNQHV
jgi:AcrR family transcriptional regulator